GGRDRHQAHPVPARQDEQDPEVPLRRALGAAALTLALAAPAHAQAATVIDFEGFAPGAAAESLYPPGSPAQPSTACFISGVSTPRLAAPPPNCTSLVADHGHDSARSLDVGFGGGLVITFAAPQAAVSLWAAVAPGTDTAPQVNQLNVSAWPGATDVG